MPITVLFFTAFRNVMGDQTYTLLRSGRAHQQASRQKHSSMSSNEDGEQRDEAKVIKLAVKGIDFMDEAINTMKEIFDCERLYQKGRPLYSHEQYSHLRQVYRQIMIEQSEDPNITEEIANDGTISSLTVPFVATYIPGKGRGVIAGRDIEKGERLWSSRTTAWFLSGDAYRQFLFSLKPEEACDVIMWSFVEDLARFSDTSEEDIRMSVDLADGSIVNNSRSPNSGCDPGATQYALEDCLYNDFALSNIRKGEEITANYNDFHAKGGWHKLQLKGCKADKHPSPWLLRKEGRKRPRPQECS